jgi:putative ABC transport system ATP-binding protein
MSVALDPQTRHLHRDDAIPLVAHALSKRHGEHARLVVDGVSLAVSRGEWLAITGPSGSGKSTLLHLLGGLTAPTAGRVRLAGVDISGRSESERARLRRRHVGYVFQRYNLIDELSIVDDVALPLRLNGVRARVARREAASLLHRLGLGERVTARPAELSGGEQQRVALARALIAGPSVVLADEPTGALDTASAAVVLGLLGDACDRGQTVVMVTHDAAVAAHARRTMHMRDGRLEGADCADRGAGW